LLFNNYAIVGDSDLTSIALAIMVPALTRITVFEIDTRIKEIIDLANKELNLDIEFVEHDLREPVPKEYIGQFDCFLTDPPYTLEGLKLFISRGLQLLSKERETMFYLSFGSKPPKELLNIQRALTDMGCLVTNIIPNFNEYIGAQKLGGVSTMYRILVSKDADPLISGNYKQPLYTGDLNPIIRTYFCMECKTEYHVGKNQSFSTIEQLKNQGCTKCKNNKFQKKTEKKME
jgi:predicted methyltransferase